MKKQFFRVKQLADQTFLRAEKSETLNYEELQIADQKIEFLRGAITSITKRIAPSGPTNDIEKVIKKTIEYQLGTTFIEESRQNRECQLFQQVLKESGLIEQQLAREYAEHEIKVEELVYAPLQSVLENEFPNVLKHKHNLRKYCLDKDSASNRYHATRKETLKEDMEEADTKVEQSRDILAIEMFNILAKENEFSEYILQLLKLQRGYHESALKNLETIIPQLEKKIGDSPVRRVFGTSLKEHLRITGKRIAYPLEICITALYEYGMSEEGLFRVAASSSKVKRLKSAIDSGCLSFLIPEYRDAHVLASILKLYLRELPEPLLTFHLHKEWMDAMQSPESHRLEIVKKIIEKLPQENRDNLSYLFQFLSKLTQHHENKMSSSNVAIVLSPNLLWIKNEKESVNIGNCVMINMLIELFIKEVDVLFPDDVSSYVTLSRLFQDEEFLNYSKTNNDHMDIIAESPRPNMRKKKSAPVPPNNLNKSDQEITTEKIMMIPNYSAENYNITKSKNLENLRDNIVINSDNSFRGRIGSEESDSNCTNTINQLHQKNDGSKDQQRLQYTTKMPLEIREVKHVDSDFLVNERPPVTSQKLCTSYQISQPIVSDAKQVLKEKLNNESDEQKSSTVKPENISDSLEEHIRKKEPVNRIGKPEVPARPLSLSKKPSTEADSVFKKTHCSVYNVADKLQPSIINIQSKKEIIPVRNKITEIENFVRPHTEKDVRVKKTELCDQNYKNVNSPTSNESTSSKTVLIKFDDSNKTKSNEQLNVHKEKSDGNPKYNHVRARSDGGVIDLEKDTNTFLQMSSRNLSKPSEPPPPPPSLR